MTDRKEHANNETTTTNCSPIETMLTNTASSAGRSDIPNALTPSMDMPSTSSCAHDMPSTSSLTTDGMTSTSSLPGHSVQPEDVLPFPKSEPRSSTNKRKKGKSRIYTSTPEKNRLLETMNEKKLKSVKKTVTSDGDTKVKAKSMKAKSTVAEESTPSTSFESDSSDFLDKSSEEEVPWLCDSDELNIKDFILVKFTSEKKTIAYYAGSIMEIIDEQITVQFLRRKPKSNQFVYPQVEDISTVVRSDVVMKLPKPISGGGTLRQTSSFFYFPLKFDSLNIIVK